MTKVTAADILKDVPITRKTLWLWQKKYHFFPDPEKKVHPGGKGIVGYYPSWVKERCEKIFALQKKGYTVAMIKEILQKEAVEKSSKKVLIVDDEKKFANLLQKFFKKNGYIVEVAYDGLEAGLKAADFLPSILLLDIALPGLNGIDVCKKLKSNQKTKNIHIFAMSGNLSYSENLLLEAGTEKFFKKPVDIAHILKECDELIDKQLSMGDSLES
jgi:CheY-like chemotaxis protein